MALGHINIRQKSAENIRYSGSILQYSFDDRREQKSVTIFDLNSEQKLHNIQEIELTAGIPLKRIEAYGVDGAIELLKSNQNFYVELLVYVNEPLKSGQVDAIYAAHDKLVSLQPIVNRQGELASLNLIEESKVLPSEIFKAFYASEYGTEPPENLVQLFIESMEKCDET